AKNFAGVAVVVDPDDYPRLLAALEQGGGVVGEPLRRELARKAFAHTAGYDAAVAGWLAASEDRAGPAAGADAGPPPLPPPPHPALDRALELRYGETPHQAGAVYATAGGPGALGGFRQLGGKELSWNNLLDADAAMKLVAQFAAPAVAIVKHNNPCG